MNEQERAYAASANFGTAKTVTGPRGGVVESFDLIVFEDDHQPIVPPGTQVRLRMPRGLQGIVTLDTDKDGRRVISRVAVSCWPGTQLPKGGIGWKALRSLRLDQVQREVELLIEREARAGRLTARDLRQLGAAPKTRKARVPEIEYARLAARYVELCGRSRSALRDLATEEHISYSSARDRIRTARDKGYLTPTEKGLGGGQLLPKAADLLKGV